MGCYLYLNRWHRRRGSIREVREERIKVLEGGLAQLLQDLLRVCVLAFILEREAADDVRQLGLRQLAERGRHVMQLRGGLTTRCCYCVLELAKVILN